MKTMIFALSMLIAAGASAKVSDFNSIIEENTQAQKQLYKEVRKESDETRTALVIPDEGHNTYVETPGDAVNVPTSKKFLRFSKETVRHDARSKDLEKRLANEFKAMDSEF